MRKAQLVEHDLAKVGGASSPPDKTNGGQGVSFLAQKNALQETEVFFLFWVRKFSISGLSRDKKCD